MKDYNFALCLTSYKRIDLLQLQIYRMLHQSYQKFHLFVAVKGCSEYTFNHYLVPHFQSFIDDGKLTLRYFPNKNQFSNFMDCIRNLDISGFDFFCKIDDDDFYTHDYLETRNKFANRFPDKHLYLWRRHERHVRRSVKGFPVFNFSGHYVFAGPTLCIKKGLIEELIEAEKSPLALSEHIKRHGLSKDLDGCGFSEDRLFCDSMFEDGVNLKDYITEEDCVVNTSTASTQRGGFHSEDFKNANYKFSKEPALWEYIVTTKRGEKSLYDVRIFNGKAYNFYFHSQGDIEKETPEELVIFWDAGMRETYKKQESGLWVLDTLL